MDFILASGNPHKAEEFQSLFSSICFEIKAAPRKLEVIEDGDTFQANALKKAKAYYDEFKKPCLSDDSGLVIPARPDILGIYSARFAPETNDYALKCERLLQEISALEGVDRSAYFVSYLCFYLSPEEIFFFEGRASGRIAEKLSGSKGFGYDPVFIPERRALSFADDPEWKEANSHRSKAVQSAIKFFSAYF